MIKDQEYKLTLIKGGVSELERIYEMLGETIKNALDLQYMTPMTALSIFKSKVATRICEIQHEADLIKIKIVKGIESASA